MCYFSNKTNHTKRIHELDVLRFLCAFTVMIYHYCYRGYADGIVNIKYSIVGDAFKYGFWGVDVFFIISGYVILMSASEKSAGKFFASRVSRLYPAFWVCVLSTTVMSKLLQSKRFYVSPKMFLVNLSMAQGLLHVREVDLSYWSLTYELFFYLFIFVVSMFITKKRHFESFLKLWLLIIILFEFFFPISTQLAKILSIKFAAPYFISGAIFYLIRSQGLSLSRIISVALCFVVLIYHPMQDFQHLERVLHFPIDRDIYLCFLGTIFCVFFLISIKPVSLARYSSVVYIMGALTYPLYLIHGNVGWMIISCFESRINKYILLLSTIALMLGFSCLIHYFVERKFCKKLYNLCLCKTEYVVSNTLADKT